MRALIFGLLLLTACSTPKPVNDDIQASSTSTNQKAPRSPGAPTDVERAEHPEWFACQVDADCKFVEMSCCDHCNGGFAIAVNKSFTSEARAAWGKNDCHKKGESVCTELACFQGQTSCVANVCVANENEPAR
jgi:hypothetical protein